MSDIEEPEIVELDPYSTLGVATTATPAEIRSAYRKKALSTHPDKAKPEDRETAHKTFQELALAYAILSDERRRKRYDETGSTAESALDDDDFNWAEFFREQYQKINVEAVEKFKKEYQGSEEERQDVLKAYEAHEGLLDGVFEDVMVSNPLNDEGRFCDIINAAIEAGEVKAYPAYTKETTASKKRRRATAEKEATEAEEYAKELGVHDELFGDKKSKPAGRKGKGKKGKEEDTAGLEALIRSRNKNRMDDLIQNLEAKYGGGGKKRKGKVVEPDEEAFQKTQKRVRKK